MLTGHLLAADDIKCGIDRFVHEAAGEGKDDSLFRGAVVPVEPRLYDNDLGMQGLEPPRHRARISVR